MAEDEFAFLDEVLSRAKSLCGILGSGAVVDTNSLREEISKLEELRDRDMRSLDTTFVTILLKAASSAIESDPSKVPGLLEAARLIIGDEEARMRMQYLRRMGFTDPAGRKEEVSEAIKVLRSILEGTLGAREK